MRQVLHHMHNQTEWAQLVNLGVNELPVAEADRIMRAAASRLAAYNSDYSELSGGGQATEKIVNERVIEI